MSLTNPFGIREREVKSIIKELTPEKSLFYSQSGLKCFDPKRECRVSSSLNPTEANLCGTAFDYSARFFIAKRIRDNKDAVVEHLVASSLFSYENNFHEITFDIEKLKKYGILVNKSKEIVCGCWQRWLEREKNITRSKIEYFYSEGIIKLSSINKDILDDLKDKYEKFRISIKELLYDDSENQDDMIIEKCIILARMEQIVRSSQGYMTISAMYCFRNNDIAVKIELQKLLDSFKNTFMPLVSEKSKVIFNPRFGIGSWMVGGADADIYIDGTLYDFKVVNKSGWSLKNATQIVGYYILDLFAKHCKDIYSDLFYENVDRVALYSVRYEEIAYYDCRNINNDLIKNVLRRIADVFILYNVFYLKRHHDDIVEKFAMPLENDSCLDWNEPHAEELNWLNKKLESGDKLSSYEKENLKKYIEIKNRITKYIQGADTVLIIEELIRKHIE